MPRYFIDVAGEDDSEHWREQVDLPDREAARSFAIGLAETILKGKEQERRARSFIVIRNDAEEMLDEVRSEQD